MAAILEELKVRLLSTQKRLTDAQQAFTAAQSELQAAQMEFNVWNTAYNLENREETARLASASKNQISMDLPEVQSQEEPHPNVEEQTTNKTELVREILRQHPAGINPADLWREFQGRASGTSRQYLYSVLKRLRDKEYVATRRGKYFLRTKPQEGESEGVVIQ
jgi:hypothetical protein